MLKNLLELNETNRGGDLFHVHLLESRSHIGGIWTFSENTEEITALRNTLQNTSRFRNCYSDFPVRDAWSFGGRTDVPPVYLSQADSAFYLQQYARKFDLLRHVKFGHKVTALRRSADGTQWELEIERTHDQSKLRSTFDKVIVATGQHHDPMIPHFEGIEHFRGRTLHAANFKG